MEKEDLTTAPDEKPDAFWHRVYAAVILTTVLVITALSFFSYYFS